MGPRPPCSLLARLAPWRRTLLFASVAWLCFSANEVCRSRIDAVWLAVTLVLGAVTAAVIRRGGSTRVAGTLYLLLALWGVGWLVHGLTLYGKCVTCPSGSSKTHIGSYWGSWVVCRQADGSPLGPAFGASYSEAGEATEYYEEYRRIRGKLVGVRVGCCYPRPCFEVCHPLDEGQSCSTALFEPPLEWKGCLNLSALVDQAFSRRCTQSGSSCF